MLDRLRNLWERLRTSLWLLPLAMMFAAVLLRLGVAWVEAAVPFDELRRWWLYSGSGDDARNLLSTLLTSLITMASLMFSITMVVLSLAANQFGSRLVRIYVGDLRTQIALGTFLMTILFCLLVLRTVEKAMPPSAVPHLGVSVALALALACILVLLFFLHFVARSIVADTVVRRVGAELAAAADRLPAASAAEPEPPGETELPCDFGARARAVRARAEGYVQAIDHGRLVEAAATRGALVLLECRPGAFVSCRDTLARVYPAEATDGGLEAALHSSVVVGDSRTPTQDLEFSVRHLVDVALRALSPGINDPNTALVAIDRLRGALARIMGRRLEPAARRDDHGVVRVVVPALSFADLVDAAFDPIRRAGRGHPAVVIHLLQALGRLAEHVHTEAQREALVRHAALLRAAGAGADPAPEDLAAIATVHDETWRRLQPPARVRARPAAMRAG